MLTVIHLITIADTFAWLYRNNIYIHPTIVPPIPLLVNIDCLGVGTTHHHHGNGNQSYTHPYRASQPWPSSSQIIRSHRPSSTYMWLWQGDNILPKHFIEGDERDIQSRGISEDSEGFGGGCGETRWVHIILTNRHTNDNDMQATCVCKKGIICSHVVPPRRTAA